jgi:diaminopropionate ammonia-lyase
MGQPEAITYVLNKGAFAAPRSGSLTRLFSPAIAQSVRRFHRSVPGYNPTPLVSLPNLARSLQIDKIWIKDESYRFNLNAFKVLGASYALARALHEMLGLEEDALRFEMFRSRPVRCNLRDITVITATDGNHGRALAWSAKQMGCNAVIYLPRGTAPARIQVIKAHGATTRIIDGNYDDAVRAASRDADENDRLLVQDTSWRGYEQIPTWIMQGYLTIAAEVEDQLDGAAPTHVFVQCGVGSLAASMQAFLAERCGIDRSPLFAVVEPTRAACFYRSMLQEDGRPAAVTGNLVTIMAGLACGEPSILAWEILKNHTHAFIACGDSFAIKGMQTLGNPLRGDERIISGESGAVTLGLLVHLRTHLLNDPITDALHLDSHSRVLLISTEGDTDPESYRKIVWGGG